MSNEISNIEDTLDVRDIIARVEELREEREDLRGAIETAKNAADEFDPEQGGGDEAELAQDITAAERDLEAWADEYAPELATLEALLADLKGNGGDEVWEGDWYPLTLIRDSYFTEAMKDLCEDIGDLHKGFPSYMVIDWKATAENLRMDYTSAEFDGVTYWFR